MLTRSDYRKIGVGVILLTLIVLSGLLVFVYYGTEEMKTGTLLYEHSAGLEPKAAGEPLAGALTIAQVFFSDFTALVTTAFGAVAFLVSVQQRNRIMPSTAAHVCLTLALAALTVALMLSLLGSEIVLTMIGNNAVDLSVAGLRIVRWSMYFSLMTAALFLGWFALELMTTTPAPAASAPGVEPGAAGG